jgi:hypothetical protein
MKYATGAEESKYDIRTFSVSAKAYKSYEGGKRYEPEDIEDQDRVGICTAIATTQNARKATGMKFSADFQYLCQKKFYDKNWREGSSGFSAMKVAKNIGFLPEEEWTHTNQSDRALSYQEYIAKLEAIPNDEIERLKTIAAKYKITAYAKVPVSRDTLAMAIDNSRAGLIVRYVVGKEWWNDPIEPIRKAKIKISGHLVTLSNYAGDSFRIANSWSSNWADNGTAYHLEDNMPTEAWAMFFWNDVPDNILKKLEERKNLLGQIADLMQKVIVLLLALKKK